MKLKGYKKKLKVYFIASMTAIKILTRQRKTNFGESYCWEIGLGECMLKNLTFVAKIVAGKKGFREIWFGKIDRHLISMRGVKM